MFSLLGIARVAFHQPAQLAAPDADERAAVAYRAAPCQDASVAGLHDPPLVRTSGVGHRDVGGCWKKKREKKQKPDGAEALLIR